MGTKAYTTLELTAIIYRYIQWRSGSFLLYSLDEDAILSLRNIKRIKLIQAIDKIEKMNTHLYLKTVLTRLLFDSLMNRFCRFHGENRPQSKMVPRELICCAELLIPYLLKVFIRALRMSTISGKEMIFFK